MRTDRLPPEFARLAQEVEDYMAASIADDGAPARCPRGVGACTSIGHVPQRRFRTPRVSHTLPREADLRGQRRKVLMPSEAWRHF